MSNVIQTNVPEYSFSDSAPEDVYRPESEADAGERIREAASRGRALVPLGGGTAISRGNRLRANRWAILSTERLRGEIEFSPEDMVVTAGSGMTLEELQTKLRSADQFLPIDHPFPTRATLGGIVATNAQGLWRGCFGLPRDRLLSVRVVLADGVAVKSGGKVVKNVAGYDLNKLFAGSWGTLGLISEVTFKTNPVPESTQHLNFQAKSGVIAAEAALAVHLARLQPIYLCVTNTPGAEFAVLSVGLMGSSEALKWQSNEISKLLTTQGLTPTDAGPSAHELTEMMEEGDNLRGRFTILPSALPSLAETLSGLGDISIRTQSSVGILDFEVSDIASGDRIRGIEGLVPLKGHLVWTSVPREWGQHVRDVWGAPRGDFHVMCGVKLALDPENRFSPGRFLGGL